MSDKIEKTEEQYADPEELRELLEEKEKLVEEGNYAEAEKIRKKIVELKQNSNRKKTSTLSQSQRKEREELEDAHDKARRDLNEKWDKKIQEFVESGKKMEEELISQHNKKMEEFIADQTTKYPKIKYSTQYLQGRRQEAALVKCERYKEAQEKKNVLDKIRDAENSKYEEERSKNINKAAENLGVKQEEELNILRARLARTYDLLSCQREKDLEQLEIKFRNQLNEMLMLHKIALNISGNINLDRAREGSKRLTNIALSGRKTEMEPDDDDDKFKK